jgi:putative hydrolase of the HAD superfamily
MSIKIILFDLGGVLVELAGLKRMAELTRAKITPDELARRWAASEYVGLYESGKCSTEIFAEGIVKELDMEITPEDFIGEFPLYAKDFFPGVVELLQELNPKYTLACLSNTNIIQWTGLCERISIDEYFQHSFLSYEIGKMKPEREIYAFAIAKLGCSPDEIVFFDDSEANVQAAVKAGMNAHRVLDFNDLKDKMKTLNLL